MVHTSFLRNGFEFFYMKALLLALLME